MNQNQRREIEWFYFSWSKTTHDVWRSAWKQTQSSGEPRRTPQRTSLNIFICQKILLWSNSEGKTMSCSLFLLWSDPTIASCNISEMQSMLLYLLQYCHTCRANMTRVVFLQFLKINILYIDGSTDLSTYLVILNKIVSFGVFAELIWRQGGGCNSTKVAKPVVRGFKEEIDNVRGNRQLQDMKDLIHKDVCWPVWIIWNICSFSFSI